MIKKTLETINSHNLISRGDKIIIGVSGGPDSVCLLHLLNSLKEKLGIILHAVHLNHMLRDEEAQKDEEYVAMLCGNLRIPLDIEHSDIRAVSTDKGISLEEAGREERYRLFEAAAEASGASKIAVAHNRNDQAETVLMRIIRGSGIDGLKGMDYKRGKIIRPLLDIKRDEIEKYCRFNDLKPRTDSSNLEKIYTRNKIRLDLIPHIDGLFNSDIIESLCRMAFLLKEDNDYIENCVNRIYNQYIKKGGKGEILLDAEKLSNSHDALKNRIIRNALKELKGDLKGIENIHISDIANLAHEGRTGSTICLPEGIRVRKSYGVIKLFYESSIEKSQFCIEISIPGITRSDGYEVSLHAEVIEKVNAASQYANPDGSPVQFFDYDCTGLGINIRNRRDGDSFKPLKSNGTKKLKEYFIDEKVPREERAFIPLVARGSEIVWIVGFKISDKFKVTDNTKLVLKLQYIKGKMG